MSLNLTRFPFSWRMTSFLKSSTVCRSVFAGDAARVERRGLAGDGCCADAAQFIGYVVVARRCVPRRIAQQRRARITERVALHPQTTCNAPYGELGNRLAVAVELAYRQV